MNIKQLLMPLAGVAASVSATGFAAPSAQFAAVYSTGPSLTSVAVITDSTVDATVDVTTTGHKLATIKVPQQKELLVGLSAEVALVTDTSLKGRLGGTAKAIAGANAEVTIYAVPTGEYSAYGPVPEPALPGTITLSERVQTLSATLAGVIQSCTWGEGDTSISIADDCLVTDEEIGLILDTTAAHHFNFVLPNMESGEYDIVAVFTTGASAEVDICTSGAECALYDEDGVISGSSFAQAFLGHTMMTIQEVRAVKGDIPGITVIAEDNSTESCTIEGVDVDCVTGVPL